MQKEAEWLKKNASSFKTAKDTVGVGKETGLFCFDGQINVQPLTDKDRKLCTPYWSEKAKSSNIMTAINELLPIASDLDLLKGGVLYDCMLHEMLISTKKTLAVNKYSEMATRLTTPSSFPVWALSDVPVAFAGKCEEDDNDLKSFDLKGPVVLTPVATFIPINEGEEVSTSVDYMFKKAIP